MYKLTKHLSHRLHMKLLQSYNNDEAILNNNNHRLRVTNS